MKKIELKTRYGDTILITKEDNNNYYTLHTKNLSYVQESYDNGLLYGIDPGGLHILRIGDYIDTTDDIISMIKPYGPKNIDYMFNALNYELQAIENFNIEFRYFIINDNQIMMINYEKIPNKSIEHYLRYIDDMYKDYQKL